MTKIHRREPCKHPSRVNSHESGIHMTFYNIRYIGEPTDPVCTVLHTEEARHPAMFIGNRIGHQKDD